MMEVSDLDYSRHCCGLKLPPGRVVASPLARSTAAAQGIDLSTVAGTGPNRRIIAADVQEAKASAPSAPAVSSTPTQLATSSSSTTGYTDIPNSGVRQVRHPPFWQRFPKLGPDYSEAIVGIEANGATLLLECRY